VSQGCTRQAGAVCGTCDTSADVGQACGGTSGATCKIGLTCDSASKTCATLVVGPAACDATHACAVGYDCVGADGGGTCQASGTAAGTPCTVGGAGNKPGCANGQGFYCNGTTKTCAAITYVGVGQACGEADGGTSDARCIASECVKGVCTAQPGPGAPCTIGKAPDCQFGLACVATAAGATTGNCLPPNSTNCH
jgi:hypothetical protein